MISDEVLAKLYNHVSDFIQKQQISCAESICQCDWIIENAYEFIEGCCDIVGYAGDDENNKEDEED